MRTICRHAYSTGCQPSSKDSSGCAAWVVSWLQLQVAAAACYLPCSGRPDAGCGALTLFLEHQAATQVAAYLTAFVHDPVLSSGCSCCIDSCLWPCHTGAICMLSNSCCKLLHFPADSPKLLREAQLAALDDAAQCETASGGGDGVLAVQLLEPSSPAPPASSADGTTRQPGSPGSESSRSTYVFGARDVGTDEESTSPGDQMQGTLCTRAYTHAAARVPMSSFTLVSTCTCSLCFCPCIRSTSAQATSQVTAQA